METTSPTTLTSYVVSCRWDSCKERLQAQWSRLTSDDLQEISGKRERLINKIQLRYGRNRNEVEREIVKWEMDYAL
jgi:uncharacterized protein YjbJ (UPF0337 family)